MSRRAATGARISAGARLGAGGQAEVFAVAEDPTLAFKRYFPRHASAEGQQKLLVMTAHVPADPARAQGHASIAWPLDVVLSDSGAFEGFVMPRVDTTVAVPLFRFYNPAARQATAPSLTWRYLLRLGANLASALDAVHRAGYVVGDLNESNALGTGTALVTLVDCDSVQVRDPTTGRVFHSPVGKPDYLAPELQGLDLSTVARVPSSDNFSLAILLYLLLMEGAHPFMGVWKGAGEPPSVPERMRRAMFPPANAQLLGPAPIALPFVTLPPELQRLFLRAFAAGIHDPTARPGAGEWRDALTAIEACLATCSVNQSHVYSGHLSDCPWCGRVAAGLADPYPGRGSGGQRALPGQQINSTRSSGASSVTASASRPIQQPAFRPLVPSRVRPRTLPGRRAVGMVAATIVVATIGLLVLRGPISNENASQSTRTTRLGASDLSAESTVPPVATTTFNDAATGISVDYPRSWRKVEVPVADYRLAVDGGSNVAFTVRVVPIQTPASAANLESFKALTDGIVASNSTVQVLKNQAISLNGMLGYYYFYKFVDGGLTAVHAQYFLFSGNKMNVLVFQSLPDDFQNLAATFDKIAESFKSDPNVPSPAPASSTTRTTAR